MSIPQIIIPDPRGGDREQQLKAYFQQRDIIVNGEFKAVNIRFQHDPEWKDRWVSIEAARNKRGIWLYVSWVFYASQAGFIGGYWLSHRR